MSKENQKWWDSLTRQARLGAAASLVTVATSLGLPAAPSRAQESTPPTNSTNQQGSETLASLENLRPFQNLEGHAYSARPGVSKEQIIKDFRQMKADGDNVVYIGHANPCEINPKGTEPGLCFAYFQAIESNSAPKQEALKQYQAAINTLEAARAVGLQVVLPIGYQIQMGKQWSAAHPQDLRRNPDGSLMSHWGSGETASPYSPAYQLDIERYYRWLNDHVIQKYQDVIVAINLGDEPMGGDYSGWAKQEFTRRYRVEFEQASDYQRGEFQAGVLADWAAWNSELWLRLNPNIRTMATFHIQRDMPFFPNFEEIFKRTPRNFIFSADTHLADKPPDQPITEQDRNLLYGMARTLGYLSKVYDKELMVWTSENAWGLAGYSTTPGRAKEAVENAQIVTTIPQEVGGIVGMVLRWNNITGQEIPNKQEITSAVSQVLVAKREQLSTPGTESPETVYYLPTELLYPYISQNSISHLAKVVDLTGFDFTNQRAIYLGDGPALQALQSRQFGIHLIPLLASAQ